MRSSERAKAGRIAARTATVVPDNERWAHTPDGAADLREALTWSQSNAPTDNNVVATLKRLRNG